MYLDNLKQAQKVILKSLIIISQISPLEKLAFLLWIRKIKESAKKTELRLLWSKKTALF